MDIENIVKLIDLPRASFYDKRVAGLLLGITKGDGRKPHYFHVLDFTPRSTTFKSSKGESKEFDCESEDEENYDGSLNYSTTIYRPDVFQEGLDPSGEGRLSQNFLDQYVYDIAVFDAEFELVVKKFDRELKKGRISFSCDGLKYFTDNNTRVLQQIQGRVANGQQYKDLKEKFIGFRDMVRSNNFYTGDLFKDCIVVTMMTKARPFQGSKIDLKMDKLKLEDGSFDLMYFNPEILNTTRYANDSRIKSMINANVEPLTILNTKIMEKFEELGIRTRQNWKRFVHPSILTKYSGGGVKEVTPKRNYTSFGDTSNDQMSQGTSPTSKRPRTSTNEFLSTSTQNSGPVPTGDCHDTITSEVGVTKLSQLKKILSSKNLLKDEKFVNRPFLIKCKLVQSIPEINNTSIMANGVVGEFEMVFMDKEDTTVTITSSSSRSLGKLIKSDEYQYLVVQLRKLMINDDIYIFKPALLNIY